MRKQIVVLSLVGLMGTSVFCRASDTTDAINRQAVLAGKKAIIANGLTMTPEEEKGFWPIYEDYQIGLNKLVVSANALIAKFEINYEKLSGETATQLVDEFFQLEKEAINYRKAGVEKFRKVLSPKNVIQFVQIENKISASERLQVAQQIPLAK